MKKHKNGFTLAEVLITLMIIGIIAAMTIPSIIQNTQNQEYYGKLKKNYAAIQNALKLAQIEQSMIGDNRALFTPSESGTASFDTAVRMAKYFNVMKICKKKSDDGCSPFFYDVSYATQKDGVWGGSADNPTLVLADGSIYRIFQYANCYDYSNGYVQDEEGNFILDESGNKQDVTSIRNYCGVVFIDVNGAKKPNKFGIDNFALNINQDTLTFNSWAAYGKSADIKKILTNGK